MRIFFKKKNRNKAIGKRGFSLIEVLVALFVFSLLIATLSAVYVDFLKAHLNAKETQRNVESAQSALNTLAKTLRTSSVLSPIATSAVSAVRIFDHSSGTCMQYLVNNSGSEKLEVQYTNNPVDEDTCKTTGAWAQPVSLIEGKVFGGFLVVPNSPTIEAGRVTTSLQICSRANTSCNATSGNPVRIQTTVSLRIN